MKNKLIVLIHILFLSSALFSQTTLSAGDLAILQYNSDNPGGALEITKFIFFREIESGTSIKFTDNGWTSAGAFRGTTEGIDVWTASRDYSCGEVVTFAFTNIALTTAGDQILVYQGAEATPTFIFAINNNGSAVWQTTSTDTNTSALPTGLTNGVNAVAVNEVDNVIYDGTVLEGARPDILSAICTAANWSGNNGSALTFTDVFNLSAMWNGSTWSVSGSDFFSAEIGGTYSTAANGNFKACNCTVDASQSLTVNSGGTVTIENNITNNGNITVNSGGSVVQIEDSGVNTGTNYTVERESTSQSSFHVFTYWSTPIETATFAAVAPSTHLYYSFDNNAQDWVLGNSSTPMSPGVGYALEGPDSGIYPGIQTSSFTGAAFNTGDIAATLSFSADGDATNDWNLVGNPYPSAIDADAFITHNGSNIAGTIYFWTHNSPEDGTEDNTEDDYAMYNAAGGTAAATGGVVPDGNIATGQGFFVQALSATTVSDFFTNAMRKEADNNSFFKRTIREKQKTKDRIWLNLTDATSFSQILVGFFDDGLDTADVKYDGMRFFAKSNLNLYSIIEGNKFGIQGKSPLKETEVILLGFASNRSGEFKISIDKFEGKIVDSNVYLEDTLLDIRHNLKIADYIFNTEKKGEFNNRFKLIIKTEKTVLNTDENKFLNEVKTINTKNGITLETLNNTIINKVAIYDLLGKEIITKQGNKNSLQIPSSLIKSNTVLIVKLTLANGSILVNKIYRD